MSGPTNQDNHPGLLERRASVIGPVGDHLGGAILGAKSESTGGLERFTVAAAHMGVEVAPVQYPQGTRTAVDAAAAIGCDVSQIVKSLVLRAGDEFIIALTAGHHRIDIDKLTEMIGAETRMATPDEARRATGYAIGGTPPFGHPRPLTTFLDPALMTHAVVYAAAGRPDTCFPLSPQVLVEATKAALAGFTAE